MIEVGQQVIGVMSQLDADLLEEQAVHLEQMLIKHEELKLTQEQVGTIEGLSNFIALLLDAIEADA